MAESTPASLIVELAAHGSDVPVAAVTAPIP
jgi:hypothetical protein